MSSITRFDPRRELVSMRDTFNRFFDQAFDWPSVASAVPVAIDLYETDEQVKVSMPLPGVKADDITVTLTGRQLTVKGEHQAKEEVREEQYYRREVRYGTFERTTELPPTADVEQPAAEFDNGVLTVSFPKLAQETLKPATKVIEVATTEPVATS